MAAPDGATGFTNVNLTGSLYFSGTQIIDATGNFIGGINLNASTVTTGISLALDDADLLTTGQVTKIASSSAVITTTGRLLLVDHSGAAGVSAVLSEFASAAADETVIVKITASAALALGTMLSLSGAAVTTGKGIAATDLNALTTGIGLHLASSATAITTTGRLAYFNHTGATGTSATLFEVASAANDETVIAQVTASAALALGTAFRVSVAALTTGIGIAIPDANALTTGQAFSIASSATAMATTGRLFLSTHSGATGTSATLNEFVSAANDETIICQITASAALALGVALKVSGVAITTGTGIQMNNLDALTTGTGLNVTSNSSDTGTRILVNIVNDNTAATGTTALSIQNDATAGSHIKLTGTGVNGIDFTALTVADTIFNVTDGQGCTAAPQTNAPTGFINILVAGVARWIPYYSST